MMASDRSGIESLNPAPLINGHDLSEAGVPRGPLLGEILRLVRDAQLEGKEFVRGDLSIVDFAMSPYLLGRHGQAMDYTPFPNVRSWLDRCNELKGIVETVFKPAKAS